MYFQTFPYGMHPYLKCFFDALKPYGIRYESGKLFNNQILLNKELTGIHFHWIEYLWESSTIYRSIKSIVGIYSFLREAKKRRKFLIWTVHNHQKHNNPNFVDKIGFLLFAKKVDLIIAHSTWSKNYILKKFKPFAPVIIMYHGNFINYFQCNDDIYCLRGKYSLKPDLPVCGLMGTIRPYRGHDIAIETMKYLDNIQLFIVGSSYSNEYLSFLIQESKKYKNIVILPKRLSDDEYAEVIKLCDLILLPYKNFTTSGALMASWSLGRSVVCSNHPYFKELIPHASKAGKIVELNPKFIADAVLDLLSISSEERYNESFSEAKKYDWNIVVIPVVEAFKSYFL